MDKRIKELVIKEFGNSNVVSGNEIKERLSKIFLENGIKWYPTIKVLKNFGYSLERKKEKEHFVYHIKLK